MPSIRNSMSFMFPPFTAAVKLLVYINGGIFLGFMLLKAVAPAFGEQMYITLGLIPYAVIHGFGGLPIPAIWQLVSYSFLHAGILHILFNMLSLWMFGSTLERDWGKQRFLEFYFFCVVGGALTTVVLSFTHVLGMSPQTMTVGASGGIYGLLVAFGILYAEQRVYIYGIFPIKAKIFAAIWVGLALFGALQETGGVANIAHLGGAAFGFIYVRWLPKRGFQLAFSERYYGARNRYHKWKRRQAAKKFEVYMREHDRSEYFDEHGNYRDPNSKGNGKGDDPSKWVN
jgi:membrane associated rhomboid family serine protease